MKPITVIGGGLAGLTLGIALRQRDVPVTIFEAGRYPRHRVCGEFVSGRGRDVLRRLGLEEKFLAVGARRATTTAFSSARGGEFKSDLPETALCLSRYVMDGLLAAEFQALGGQLHTNERRQEEVQEGMVRATGRRTKTAVEGWRWFGLKSHARHVEMSADVEVHLLPEGYVGLCRLDAETVNVCGLFRSRAPVPDLAQKWPAWLRGDDSRNPTLRERLGEAEFCPDTFCSVSGLWFSPQAASLHGEFCIGDAITMIAPFTGNGMSMAFESAELAAGPLTAYSQGSVSWKAAAAATAEACDRMFAPRLKWSQILQNGLLSRQTSGALIWLAARAPAVWRLLYARMR